MTLHKCDKEVEISEIHHDIKVIRKLLEGNGKPGLIDIIDNNKTFRIQQETRNNLFKWSIGSGWFITIIVLIVTFFISL